MKIKINFDILHKKLNFQKIYGGSTGMITKLQTRTIEYSLISHTYFTEHRSINIQTRNLNCKIGDIPQITIL